MNVIRDYPQPCTLDAFLTQHNLSVVVQYRQKPRREGVLPFYATLRPFCELSVPPMLRGICGNGETEEEAIADIGPQISEGVIVFGANALNRLEVKVPKLIG